LGERGNIGKAGEESGAAMHSEAAVHLRNSILGPNRSGVNVSGPVADEGYNLSSDATPALTAAGSRNELNPLLGEVAAGGALVPVLTLASNSPAINAIVAEGGNGCPGFDQRKALRVEPCDIGAYEHDGEFTTPPLTAELGVHQVILSWPASTAFVLQQAATLASKNEWITVSTLPPTVNGLKTLRLGSTNPAGFYRLRRP
jgi:hypothetical protein